MSESAQTSNSKAGTGDATSWWRSPIYRTFLLWLPITCGLHVLCESGFTNYLVRDFAELARIAVIVASLCLMAGWMTLGEGDAIERWTACWLLACLDFLGPQLMNVFYSPLDFNVVILIAVACMTIGVGPLLLLMIPYAIGVLSARFALVKATEKDDEIPWSQFTMSQLIGITVMAGVLFGFMRLSSHIDDHRSDGYFWWWLLIVGVLPPALCHGILRSRLYPFAPISLAIAVYAIALPILNLDSFMAISLAIGTGIGITGFALHLIALRIAGYRLQRFAPNPHPAWRGQPIFLDIDNLQISPSKSEQNSKEGLCNHE